MPGPKGNSEFCFPESSMRVEEEQNSLFPEGSVIKCFIIPPDSKLEKKTTKNDLLNTTVAVPAVRAAETQLSY